MHMLLAALLLAMPCESLKSLSLPNATITRAGMVGSGQFTPPGGGQGRGAAAFKDVPEFCRIAITLKPTSDSDIKVEVWLPTKRWNGNFQAAGNGGLAGSIGFAAMAGFLRDGYAAAGTDTGHEGMTGEFIIGHPEKLKDYAYRAFHEMTVASKAIIKAYYGSGPKLSVLNIVEAAAVRLCPRLSGIRKIMMRSLYPALSMYTRRGCTLGRHGFMTPLTKRRRATSLRKNIQRFIRLRWISVMIWPTA